MTPKLFIQLNRSGLEKTFQFQAHRMWDGSRHAIE